MRNVVTLSDIPKELHDWLKKEAISRSRQSGKRIAIYQIVVQAIQELKDKHEKPLRRQKTVIPKIEIFRKKIQFAEISRGCICVPKTSQSHFKIGNIITIRDDADSSIYAIEVQSQHRLDMKKWYEQHADVKHGNEIIFEQQTDGFINIKVVSL